MEFEFSKTFLLNSKKPKTDSPNRESSKAKFSKIVSWKARITNSILGILKTRKNNEFLILAFQDSRSILYNWIWRKYARKCRWLRGKRANLNFPTLFLNFKLFLLLENLCFMVLPGFCNVLTSFDQLSMHIIFYFILLKIIYSIKIVWKWKIGLFDFHTFSVVLKYKRANLKIWPFWIIKIEEKKGQTIHSVTGNLLILVYKMKIQVKKKFFKKLGRPKNTLYLAVTFRNFTQSN